MTQCWQPRTGPVRRGEEKNPALPEIDLWPSGPTRGQYTDWDVGVRD